MGLPGSVAGRCTLSDCPTNRPLVPVNTTPSARIDRSGHQISQRRRRKLRIAANVGVQHGADADLRLDLCRRDMVRCPEAPGPAADQKGVDRPLRHHEQIGPCRFSRMVQREGPSDAA
jgi:hypothetical protein